MFHWICPECGREIPPAVKECPVCDPQTVVEAAVELAPVARVAAEPAQPPPLPVATLAPVLPPPAAEPVDPSPSVVPQVARQLAETQINRARRPVLTLEPVAQHAPEVKESQAEVAAEPAPEPAQPMANQVAQLAKEPQASEPEVAPETAVKAPEPLADPVAQLAKELQEAQPEVAPEPAVKASEPLPDPVAQLAKELRESQPEVAPEPAVKAPEPLPDPVAQLAKELRETQPEVAPEPTPEPAEPLPDDPVLQLAEKPEPARKTPEPLPDPILKLASQLENAQPEVVPQPALGPSDLLVDPLRQLAQQLRQSRREPQIPAPQPRVEAEQSAATALPMPEQEPSAVAVALLEAPSVSQPDAVTAPVERPQLEPEPSVATTVPVPRAVARAPLGVSLASAAPLPVALSGSGGKPFVEASGTPAGPALALGPMQDYASVAIRKIRPAPPSGRILTPDAGPRITLPGPTLPHQLHSLSNAGISTVMGMRPGAGARKSGPNSNWMVSALAAVLMFAALACVVLYAIPHFGADPKSAAPAGVAPDAVEAATPPPAAYPLSKSVEVTGFRFVNENGKNPEVHYLVVNHSSAEMPAVTVYVSLRSSAAKPGQPPLCKFSFRAAGMGAYEAKEMTSALDKLPRPSDWQELQAEIALGQ